MTRAVSQSETDLRKTIQLFNLRFASIETDVATLDAFGKVFAEGAVTLDLSSATTNVTVTDMLATDRVLISPASAAAVSLDGYAYVSTVAAGSFTLTHDNSTQAGRTYSYAVLRG